MNTYEIIAQVRMMVSADSPGSAEDSATIMLEEVSTDIEHIEVLS